MNYKPVVGLEIHLQVKTKTKMFSRSRADYFNEPPNTLIDPVNIGMPGTLPVPNKLAFEKALKLALALNCKITETVNFDRKNYFYPDIPKGYQISQFDKPIGVGGFVEIEVGDDSRRIRLIRLHLEEDTGKSIHSETGETFVDYNKSGIPLIEMVTEPDFDSVEEVIAFAKRLRQIARYTDTSDAEMQKGQMRFELNISVKPEDQKELPDYKVEVKNIGSISVLEKVIKYELERQSKEIEEGVEMKSQTRGLKGMTGETIFQRFKETSDDYRYFPEPDIPPIYISQDDIARYTEQLPEMPHERKQRYLALKLNPEQAEVFVEDREMGDYLDQVIRAIDEDDTKNKNTKIEKTKVDNDKDTSRDKAEAAKMLISISGISKKNEMRFSEIPIDVKDVLYLVDRIRKGVITASSSSIVIQELFNHKGKSAEEIVGDMNLLQMSDETEIDNIVDSVIKDNQKVVNDIQKNPNAIKFLIGQVMRLSKGKINPNTAEEKIKNKLSNSNT